MNYMQPAEWIPHRACWLAWPSHAELWEENLPFAQKEFTALCQAIAAPASSRPQEQLEILVPSEKALQDAQTALQGLPVRFHRIPFGDIWVRDTGPIFTFDKEGKLTASRFKFNGWGEKYSLPHDPQVSEKISAALSFRSASNDWILEGGSIESDGEGTCLTSSQCLLNKNRNPQMGLKEIEEALKKSLGFEKILWLRDGLLNDHTDGHIDTIARFVAPGVVMCMRPGSADDPNKEVFAQMLADLKSFTDAKGRKLKVIEVISPGKILDEEGEVMPASYMNFYIANNTVVVPVYGSPNDSLAVEEIAKAFPDRKTIGLSAKAILSGGGAFHCITQQEPLI